MSKSMEEFRRESKENGMEVGDEVGFKPFKIALAEFLRELEENGIEVINGKNGLEIKNGMGVAEEVKVKVREEDVFPPYDGHVLAWKQQTQALPRRLPLVMCPLCQATLADETQDFLRFCYRRLRPVLYTLSPNLKSYGPYFAYGSISTRTRTEIPVNVDLMRVLPGLGEMYHCYTLVFNVDYQKCESCCIEPPFTVFDAVKAMFSQED